MTAGDPVRDFEVRVLRPIWIALIGMAIVLALSGDWIWLGASVFAVLLVGVIGSQLHPLQSASNLAQGPLESHASHREITFANELRRVLVDRACLHVGMFLGVVAFVVAFWAIGVRWYVAGFVACFVLLVSGALLKVAFKTV